LGSRRFTRLTNGFSKKLDNHVAAVALYVAHYNLCRTHEALRTTPAKRLATLLIAPSHSGLFWNREWPISASTQIRGSVFDPVSDLTVASVLISSFSRRPLRFRAMWN
jgi:hypothetical protein